MYEATASTAVLDRLLAPLARCFTTEVARQIAGMRADPATQSRLDEFAGKASQGELTPEERGEYAALVDALDVVGILQAKARRTLAVAAS